MTVRVLHLAPAHLPFDPRVFVKECRTLARAGYVVSLVVPAERSEVVDGVRIIAIPRWSSRSGRFFGNIWRTARIAWSERADIYHFHDPEMIPVGVVLALLGRTVIYDSHEDLPRLVLDRSWIRPSLRPMVGKTVEVVERLIEPLFAAIISAEDEGAQRFRSSRVVIVRNYVVAEEFADAVSVPLENRDDRVVYIGALSAARGAVEMVEAVERTKEGVRLTLAGYFGDGSEEIARDLPGWDRVDFLGVADRNMVERELGRAKIGLVLLHPTRKYAEGAIPVKLFEYLAAGLAVVVSDFPAWREIVAPADVGILVDPLDVDAVAAAINTLLDDPDELAAIARRGPAVVREQYSWESEAIKLLALYEQVSPEPSGTRRG